VIRSMCLGADPVKNGGKYVCCPRWRGDGAKKGIFILQGVLSPPFQLRNTCISAVYAVVRCLPVTFMQCVKTAKDTAIVVAEFERNLGNRIIEFEWYHFQWSLMTHSP